MMSLKCFLRK